MPGILTQLDILTPPQQEPVSLTKLKAYLHATDFEDNVIEDILQSSRQEVEEKTSRAFLTQTLMGTFFFTVYQNEIEITDYQDQMMLELPRSPTQQVISVAVENTPNTYTIIDPSNYGVMLQTPTLIYLYAPAFGGITYPWWIETNLRPRVQVQYIAGYTDISKVPSTYKNLIVQIAAYHYFNRESSDLPPAMNSIIQSKKVWTL